MYKGDRQKHVEEQQKLFQEHKVNPLGGCLPLLAQFPVFITLFRVLRSTYQHVPTNSRLFHDLCGSNQTTVKECGKAGAHHLRFLSMDLSVSALRFDGPVFHALPYFIMVGMVVLTGYIQSKQTQRTTPKGGANTQMQMIGKVLPVVFGVISLNFPAGLVVYFFISNLWRLGQQEVIFRKIHLPHRERQAAKKGGGGAAKPAIDVESRPAPPADAAIPETPAPAQSPKAASPKATSPPEPEPEAPAAAPSGGGRLRGLFGLPAAPNGEPAPARPAAAGKATAAGAARGGSASRSNQGRRRRNKKRKR